MPPYFGVDRLPVLAQFFENWPKEIPLAVEVRHESWFENSANFEQLVELSQKHRKPLVITDVAGRRDVLHLGLSTPTTMVRFVGNGLHPTDYERIDEWVELLKKWSSNGVKEIYFFPHQPDNILTPEISNYIAKSLIKIPGIITRGPDLRDENKQLSLL